MSESDEEETPHHRGSSTHLKPASSVSEPGSLEETVQILSSKLQNLEASMSYLFKDMNNNYEKGMKALQQENAELKRVIASLSSTLQKLQSSCDKLPLHLQSEKLQVPPSKTPTATKTTTTTRTPAAAPAAAAEKLPTLVKESTGPKSSVKFAAPVKSVHAPPLQASVQEYSPAAKRKKSSEEEKNNLIREEENNMMTEEEFHEWMMNEGEKVCTEDLESDSRLRASNTPLPRPSYASVAKKPTTARQLTRAALQKQSLLSPEETVAALLKPDIPDHLRTQVIKRVTVSFDLNIRASEKPYLAIKALVKSFTGCEPLNISLLSRTKAEILYDGRHEESFLKLPSKVICPTPSHLEGQQHISRRARVYLGGYFKLLRQAALDSFSQEDKLLVLDKALSILKEGKLFRGVKLDKWKQAIKIDKQELSGLEVDTA